MDKQKENDTKYLYGASVQGIQDFIFQTNKLKEIVGASELVEQICTEAFEEFGRKEDSIVRAAGNIKHIFNSEDECKKAVLEFPRKVMMMAPGITISQAVVKMDGNFAEYEKTSNELEKYLQIKRNRAVRLMTLGLMAISRAPSTGFPAVNKNKDGFIDEASHKKLQEENVKSLMCKMTGNKEINSKQIAYDIEDLEGKKSWIAVIHIDGNGLGNIVQKVCKNADDAKTFSSTLDDITQTAAKIAFNSESVCGKLHKGEIIPIRPVVLGGDDLTVICRADLAISFTKIFLEEFEKESKLKLAELGEKYDIVKKGLTACAGIAFVKSSYPFHYAVHLAESLCERAKKKAKEINKELAPSCLMFHKIQDSFVEDFHEIVKRELTPQPDISFEFGPYYCGSYALNLGEKCENTVEKLISNAEKLEGKEGNAIKSHIRQWLSLLFDNKDVACQKMKRLLTINKKAKDFIPDKYENLENVKKIPYHDILALASILINEKKEGANNE